MKQLRRLASAFRAPDSPLESQDASVYLRRSGIHIIDLQQTVQSLNAASENVRKTVAKGGTGAFVGTKRQAQATIEHEAFALRYAVHQPALAGRHADQLGHDPPAYQYLLKLERRMDAGEFRNLPKKERLKLARGKSSIASAVSETCAACRQYSSSSIPTSRNWPSVGPTR